MFSRTVLYSMTEVCIKMRCEIKWFFFFMKWKAVFSLWKENNLCGIESKFFMQTNGKRSKKRIRFFFARALENEAKRITFRCISFGSDFFLFFYAKPAQPSTEIMILSAWIQCVSKWAKAEKISLYSESMRIISLHTLDTTRKYCNEKCNFSSVKSFSFKSLGQHVVCGDAKKLEKKNISWLCICIQYTRGTRASHFQ